jgi:hypothetical protein
MSRKTPKQLRVEEKTDEWGIESYFDDQVEEE